MFLDFNPFLLLFWIIISSFIPGAILSLSILKDKEGEEDNLPLIDKIFIGFALGLIIVPSIPFLLYLVLGIKFTHSLAVGSVVVTYIIAIGAFVLSRLHMNFSKISKPDFTAIKQIFATKQTAKPYLISFAILLIVLVAFWIRLSTYSPIFQELDPYYYTFVTQQLIVHGENPLDDKTGWYPELKVNHRAVPDLAYLEATWYMLYNGSAQYNNMLLAVIAASYPPIAAALAVFFIYLFISAGYKREWAVIGAGIASFVPMFIYKTVAGEMEIQPYAFFALSFFFAMYAMMIKKRDMRFAFLAGIAYFGLSLGSSSEIVATAALIIFIPLYTIMLYFKEEDSKPIKFFFISNLIVVLIGPLFGTALAKSLFVVQTVVLGTTIAMLAITGFIAAVWLIKERADQKLANTVVGVLLVVGLIVFFFTPIGAQIKTIAASGIGIVSFDTALKRTIAEQGTASNLLAQQIGFVAETYPVAVASVFAPISSSTPSLATPINEFLIGPIGGFFDVVFSLFSVTVNIVMALSVAFLNAFLGLNITWLDKGNSMLMFWIFFFWVAILLSFRRTLKDKPTLFLLYTAVVLPPVLVGIMKAKYTIYAGFLLAVGIAAVFGELDKLITPALRKRAVEVKEKNEKSTKRKTAYYVMYYFLLLIALFVLLMQFAHLGFASSLLKESFKPRFQDNPAALQSKFKSFCTTLKMGGGYDADICSAAENPMAYANKSTNHQYNRKLCIYSLASDITKLSPSEQQAASLRCQRLSDYWIESMEWIRYNTENNSRTTSWWDYGHWINFFGQKNTVLRNEHLSLAMIGEVAHAYVDGTSDELQKFMKAHDSKYALFDTELIAGGGSLGGKYGALNYLSCVRSNGTNVSNNPGQSACEFEHLWEQIFIPLDQQNRPTGEQCTISKDKKGVKVYHLEMLHQSGKFIRTPYYPGQCVGIITNPNAIAVCQQNVRKVPVYCLGEVLMADNKKTTGFYYLNETYANGDLKLNKGQIGLSGTLSGTFHFGNTITATIFYNKQKIWLENGLITDGYEDRKGKFYDSNLYKGVFMNQIEGFDHVFTSKGGQVKIYRMK